MTTAYQPKHRKPDGPSVHQEVEMELLDRVELTARKQGKEETAHFVRAVAHDLGYHLSSCVGGRRLAVESDFQPARSNQ